MRILVFNVPAQNVGALSIMNDFYNNIKMNSKNDIDWIFVLSLPQIDETDNIKVLNYPWVKKSWFHRLFFDYFIAPYLVSKYKASKILSFQNTLIPFSKVEQTLYFHNSLPFAEHKFRFKDNKLLWFYQNIISKLMFRSLKKADKIIVQSSWMKVEIAERININSDIISVVPPRLSTPISKYFHNNEDSMRTFIYPASEHQYKNHELIVKASTLLNQNISLPYKIYFTLSGFENSHISKLKHQVEMLCLPIYFIGEISREKVYEMYSHSILVFPSYIETYGLPLKEAKEHHTLILAANTPFSREILINTPNAYFFDPFNENELYSLMMQILTGEIQYKDNYKNDDPNNKNLTIDDVLIDTGSQSI